MNVFYRISEIIKKMISSCLFS